MKNELLRYEKWPKEHALSGAVIEKDELGKIYEIRPFALKFDDGVDAGELDRLDQLLGADKAYM